MSIKTYSLDELCQFTDSKKRTVRYYIQLGLVSRPVGEGRAARYTVDHLNQLLRIKQLSEAGVSLGRIREVLAGEEAPVPLRERQPGAVAMSSNIYVAPGIEMQIAHEKVRMSAEQLRAFARDVIARAAPAVGKAPNNTGRGES